MRVVEASAPRAVTAEPNDGRVHVRLDWLGTATFRLTRGDRVFLLDAYIDRVPAALPVGISIADIDRADAILVGHSHFDHLWGAERIALATGALVVGSYETVRLLIEAGVDEGQCVVVSGGERVRLAEGVTARVLPSQHSCIWTRGSADAAEECFGDEGLTLQERQERFARAGAGPSTGESPGMAMVRAHIAACPHKPRGDLRDGGTLAFLIDTPEGSILWKDTSGHWSGILNGLRPDVAILAAAGRGNIDGEPIQGSLAQFVAREVQLLRPRRVILGHHDDWMPPLTRSIDVGPIRAELARSFPEVELVEMGYLAGYALLEPPKTLGAR